MTYSLLLADPVPTPRSALATYLYRITYNGEALRSGADYIEYLNLESATVAIWRIARATNTAVECFGVRKVLLT